MGDIDNYIIAFLENLTFNYHYLLKEKSLENIITYEIVQFAQCQRKW